MILVNTKYKIDTRDIVEVKLVPNGLKVYFYDNKLIRVITVEPYDFYEAYYKHGSLLRGTYKLDLIRILKSDKNFVCIENNFININQIETLSYNSNKATIKLYGGKTKEISISDYDNLRNRIEEIDNDRSYL